MISKGLMFCADTTKHWPVLEIVRLSAIKRKGGWRSSVYFQAPVQIFRTGGTQTQTSASNLNTQLSFCPILQQVSAYISLNTNKHGAADMHNIKDGFWPIPLHIVYCRPGMEGLFCECPLLGIPLPFLEGFWYKFHTQLSTKWCKCFHLLENTIQTGNIVSVPPPPLLCPPLSCNEKWEVWDCRCLDYLGNLFFQKASNLQSIVQSIYKIVFL